MRIRATVWLWKLPRTRSIASLRLAGTTTTMSRSQRLLIFALAGLAPMFATAADLVQLAPGALEVPPATLPAKRVLTAVDEKLHTQLLNGLDAISQGTPPQSALHLPAALRQDNSVLVEVLLHTNLDGADVLALYARHGGTIRNSMSGAMQEVWMPLDRLRELASETDVARIIPARLARPLAPTISQGVAASNTNYWQTFNPAYTGTGITIAMVDVYDKTKIAALQTSGDWPPNARLSCFDLENIGMTQPPYTAVSCTGSTFGAQGKSHGEATMELAYDFAPGATYRAYDTVTVGDWYNAILDAANVNSSGTSLGAVKANVISASLAAPLDGIGDGTAQTGSIAQAAGYAKNKGVLVVNAAGNERENHWGGLYALSTTGSGFHTWNGSNTIYNPFGDGAGTLYCIAAGETINVEMYWNDWTSPGPTHDYDLYLYEGTGNSASPTWSNVAASNSLQDGGSSQTPTEQIQGYTTIGGTITGCPSGSALYAIAVVRVAGTTANDNLQVFASASNGEALYYRVNARSLDFPADSPNVLSVAAIDVANATKNPQEPFSSEGPVLAAGGGIPTTSAGTDPNLKPDLASFDDVTTVTTGAGKFFGTSAATPQAAGMAALFMQRFGIQTTATNLTNVIINPLRAIAATGSNDLGTAGKDYQYGNGRLRFQKDASLMFVQQPVNTLVNTAFAPAIKVGIYDSEGNPNLYTLFNSLTLAIGNDPHGGSAVLSGGGTGTLTAGVATYSAAKINLGGNGYTLQATATAAATPPINLIVTSNAFNITTGAASKLAFTVQPTGVIAGHTFSPPVQVSVEDSLGNVINSSTNYQITIKTVACSSAVPAGGGPVTSASAVAAFPNLTLDKAGTGVQLQATASGLATATSSSFTVSANSDWIFNSDFETCTP